MQMILHVICSQGPSLREAIVNDKYLAICGLKVHTQHKPGRKPGWAKLRATNSKHHGSVNVEWHPSTAALVFRVITRGTRGPSDVLGNLMRYLFEKHRSRVKAIIVLSGRLSSRTASRS